MSSAPTRNIEPDADARTRADIEPILKEVVEILVREYQPESILMGRLNA
ncbi:MAG: hypothetical protein V2A61_07295 [Calditrichota bacterium]